MKENKFKVGDKVQCIDSVCSLNYMEIYTVSALHGDCGIFLTGQEDWWNVWRFELVESAENTEEKEKAMKESTEGMSAVSKANEFKVGDKVKYIGTSSYYDLKTGDVKVITDILKETNSGEIYGVNLKGVIGWVYPQNLRLVKSAENARNMEEHSYSVEEVIEALMYVYTEGWSDTKWQIIADTKAELEKRKNPEYLKYLELKEKFEPSVF